MSRRFESAEGQDRLLARIRRFNVITQPLIRMTAKGSVELHQWN